MPGNRCARGWKRQTQHRAAPRRGQPSRLAGRPKRLAAWPVGRAASRATRRSGPNKSMDNVGTKRPALCRPRARQGLVNSWTVTSPGGAFGPLTPPHAQEAGETLRFPSERYLFSPSCSSLRPARVKQPAPQQRGPPRSVLSGRGFNRRRRPPQDASPRSVTAGREAHRFTAARARRTPTPKAASGTCLQRGHPRTRSPPPTSPLRPRTWTPKLLLCT